MNQKPVKLKLYFPLSADFYPDKVYWNPEAGSPVPQTITEKDLVYFSLEIRSALRRELKDGTENLLIDGNKGLSVRIKEKVLNAGLSIETEKGELLGCVSVLQREPLTSEELNDLMAWLEHQLKGQVQKRLVRKKIQVCDGYILLRLRNQNGDFFRKEPKKEKSGLKRKNKGKEESHERKI